jgi:regulator of replication initiation timing
MKAAIDILDTGDMELIESRLHLPLKVVQKSIDNNMKWSSEVVAAFERLNQLIQEVHLAAVDLQRVKTAQKEQVAANKTIEELKNQDLEEYLSNRKKQVKEDLDKQSQTEQDLLEAYLSIPTDMDRISLDLAQFVTGNFLSRILLLVDL